VHFDVTLEVEPCFVARQAFCFYFIPKSIARSNVVADPHTLKILDGSGIDPHTGSVLG
jgi:hypothetical protein